MRTALILSTLGLMLKAPTADAQAARVSIQVAIAKSSFVASNASVGGLGGDVQLRFKGKYFSHLGVVSVGVGAQLSTFSGDNDVGITTVGGFLEPRLLFAIGDGQFGPYVGARVGYSQQSNTVAASSGGLDLGAVGGVEVLLNRRVTLDAGVSAIAQSFQASSTPAGIAFLTGSTMQYAVRAGLRFGL
jgi:hypothetical protein